MEFSRLIWPNLHFAAYLFLAFACIAAGWLYFDADRRRFRSPTSLVWVGFALVAAGFFVESTNPTAESGLIVLASGMRVLGYTAVLCGRVLVAPLKRPHTRNPILPPDPAAKMTSPASGAAAIAIFASAPVIPALSFTTPLVAVITAAVYWRQAVQGLERHLKPLALGLSLLAVFELANVLTLSAATSTDPILQTLVAPLSGIWIAEHLLVTLAGVVIVWWTWRYFTKQLRTQILFFVMSAIGVVTITTTVTIATLLLGNIAASTETNLHNAAQALTYAISSQSERTTSNATIAASTPSLIAATTSSKSAAVQSAIEELSKAGRNSNYTIVAANGVVLSRSNNPDRYGDALTSNPTVRKVLAGRTISGNEIIPGAITPQLVSSAWSPITQNGQVIGGAQAVEPFDNTFVDTVKRDTGLNATIFAGDLRSASTFTAPNGKDRLIGTRETNASVLNTVLKQGKSWHGQITIARQPYFAAYIPLKDASGTTVGMLSLNTSQLNLQDAANRAIKLNYLAAIIWLVAAIGPVAYLSHRIAAQLR